MSRNGCLRQRRVLGPNESWHDDDRAGRREDEPTATRSSRYCNERAVGLRTSTLKSAQLKRGAGNSRPGLRSVTITGNSSARMTETTAPKRDAGCPTRHVGNASDGQQAMEGHHSHFVKLGRSALHKCHHLPRRAATIVCISHQQAEPAVLCSIDGMVSPTVHSGPFSANSTAQTKDGPRGKSDKIDGGLFGPPAAYRRKFRLVVLQKLAITSRTGHSPHLTTRRTVRHE